MTVFLVALVCLEYLLVGWNTAYIVVPAGTKPRLRLVLVWPFVWLLGVCLVVFATAEWLGERRRQA